MLITIWGHLLAKSVFPIYYFPFSFSFIDSFCLPYHHKVIIHTINHLLKYTEDAINLASEIGNVEALQWWFDSGLDSKYDSRALDRACEFGQLEVLDAWKHSGLELNYTSAAIRKAKRSDHGGILAWCEDSMRSRGDTPSH